VTALSFVEDTADAPPRDTTPPFADGGDFNPEYPGSTKEAPYGFTREGKPRVRKPYRYGDGQGGTTDNKAGRSPQNEKLAQQASDVLTTGVSIVGTIAMAVGFQRTAGAMAANIDGLAARNVAALQTDPALCRMILRAGPASARLVLVGSFAMFGFQVAPTAVAEWREFRDKGEGDDGAGTGDA
jgi:hypothetical protein